mmetsp:Transcript_6607/g.8377  ORF Transcript_6607/g.8377 Transcript_6607/m.8377 type:complete len:229 (-) Transcript_6607:293-979(-)
MKFHGGSDIDDVIDAMEYATYVHDVEHVILDNMQFMLSRNTRGFSNFDKFDMQDIAVEKFRKFATEHNVHVTLVVHPRKENEGDKLGMSSFYGTAKSTQEADNVLILQNTNGKKFIEVKKNRFDGATGYSPLFFQSNSNRYVDHQDVSVVNKGNRSQGGTGTGGSSTTVMGTTSNNMYVTKSSTRSLSSTNDSQNNSFDFVSASQSKKVEKASPHTEFNSTYESILER